MKRFMIGQFEKFDFNKQQRDFRDGFWGIEATCFEKEEEVEVLSREIEKLEIGLGIHFPLRQNLWRLRDPQYLSKDSEVKIQSLEYMDKEFKFLQSLKPEYILTHYPKPVILDDKADWTNWRFADDTEYYFESRYSYEEFKDKSQEFFKWLSDKGYEYNFTPVLELDAVNKYIYNTNLLEELLNKFTNIKLCLDIGRLHLQHKLDENFDSFELLRRYGKYAKVIHLWNVRVESNVTGSHYPTLKALKKEDGWADIEEYMKIIREENKECKILFEHRSDLITDEELNECYEWIKELLGEEENIYAKEETRN